MDVDLEHKKKIYNDIVEVIITALEKNELSSSEIPKIANFVLVQIDAVNNHEDLITFLKNLSNKWPIFENIEEIEKGEVKDQKEEEVAEGVLQMAKSGNVEEAINLAKTMTE